jgi:hypothetical protein
MIIVQENHLVYINLMTKTCKTTKKFIQGVSTYKFYLKWGKGGVDNRAYVGEGLKSFIPTRFSPAPRLTPDPLWRDLVCIWWGGGVL